MSESKEQQERYGFVVFTGRHKILDYHKPDGQQIATADNEDAARTIVRALNAHASHAALVEAVRHALAIETSTTMAEERKLRGQAKAIYKAALALAEKEI